MGGHDLVERRVALTEGQQAPAPLGFTPNLPSFAAARAGVHCVTTGAPSRACLGGIMRYHLELAATGPGMPVAPCCSA